MLARIRKRLGTELARALDAEDIFQESLAAAIRSRGRVWSGGRSGLHRYLLGIAERRIRHEARRQHLRRSLPLDEPVVREQAPGLGAELPPMFERVPDQATSLRPTHRWAVFLRDWMDTHWATVEFLLERRSPSAAQGLHNRARSALGLGLEREAT
jgi:DNA-directed RNA polymerase specialized sigma24 family protein